MITPTCEQTGQPETTPAPVQPDDHIQPRHDKGGQLGRDLLALLGLAVATVGFFWQVVAGQAWLPGGGGDLASFLYPTYRFAAEQIRQFSLPLWNPHLYGGAPHVADIQAGFLYPFNVIAFLLLPELRYAHMQWLSIFHFWWAGAGMYLFLRYGTPVPDGGRLRRLAATAGALAFMFCEPFLIHFGNLNLNAVGTWLPWALLGVSRALDGKGWWWAAFGGLCIGLSTLAGHAQITLFVLMTVTGYSVLWGLTAPRDASKSDMWKRALGVPVLANALGLALAAPILLPGLELSAYTERVEWTYTRAAEYSLSPAQWIGMLAPAFFGRGVEQYWGPWDRVEVGYVGILTLLLAALAVARGGRQALIWTALGAGAFFTALGEHNVLHGWLTQMVPGFAGMRAPARATIVMDLALAVLAARGLHLLLEPLEDRTRAALRWVYHGAAVALVLAGGVFAPLVYLTVLDGQGRDPVLFQRFSVAAQSTALFVGLLLAAVAVLALRYHQSWWQGEGRNWLGWTACGLIFFDLAGTGAHIDLGRVDPSHNFDHDEIVAFLWADPDRPFRIDARTSIEGVWQPNTAMIYGLQDIWGVANPLTLAHYERYWEALGSRSTPLYDLLNIRYVIAYKDVVLDWDKFELAHSDAPHLNVYRNPDARPRAFLVYETVRATDWEGAWNALHAEDFDPTQTVVLERDLSEPSQAAPGDEHTVSFLHYGAAEIRLQVSTAAPAILVLSEVWYPGWSAWVDGREAEVLRANYAFRAVPVPAGTHEVYLRFAPAGWRWGWMIAIAGWLTLVVWTGWWMTSGHRRRS